ncbi:hypothetical protein PF005_g31566 [Phytophthora fragariae]|uniref:Cyclic nucleotide-binding domain-containing protein n=1 Tax=Phytophthora fragariae TaxID=53985 RepID=A0A6A3RN29_9STRA|nr:hypothetical protein PF003_g11997 [Phytophthora fragariae]KAE9100521.1 hypothetical protein PF006_g22883 [Phytophthora fragariae]KAE9160631.1 hypothetical protein PF005_g31566 [Phytophthora fragariae]KAE9164628.1 hypothetical protein PF002_g31557 [Phytophthora fragariae]
MPDALAALQWLCVPHCKSGTAQLPCICICLRSSCSRGSATTPLLSWPSVAFLVPAGRSSVPFGHLAILYGGPWVARRRVRPAPARCRAACLDRPSFAAVLVLARPFVATRGAV